MDTDLNVCREPTNFLPSTLFCGPAVSYIIPAWALGLFIFLPPCRILTCPVLLPAYFAIRASIPFVDPAGYSRKWLLITMVRLRTKCVCVRVRA